MEVDWRLGAELFECLLLDHDPCSNYGNWTYVAGAYEVDAELGDDCCDDCRRDAAWQRYLRTLRSHSTQQFATSEPRDPIPLQCRRGRGSARGPLLPDPQAEQGLRPEGWVAIMQVALLMIASRTTTEGGTLAGGWRQRAPRPMYCIPMLADVP